MTKQLYSVEEAASHLDLHVKTVRRFIQEGRLKARRVGKEYRITRADLEAFGGAPPEEPAVVRTRQVIVSSIVDVTAISREDSDRLTTYLLASLNGRRGEDDSPRVDCIAMPERGQLRITITAGPTLTCELLRMVNAMLESAAN